MPDCLSFFADEGISLSTISQRRMSANFDRRIANSALERRLSGGKTHTAHRERVSIGQSLPRSWDPGFFLLNSHLCILGTLLKPDPFGAEKTQVLVLLCTCTGIQDFKDPHHFAATYFDN
jgi:hypothetical protein